MDLAHRVDRVVDRAIAENRIVGSVTTVLRHGELVYSRAAGWLDREAGIPMRTDAIFRLSSVTKPITATAALAMIERGLLSLDDKVLDFLPYFAPKLPDGSTPAILIRHLLSHTSGLGYDFSADPIITTGGQNTDLSFEENFTRIARQPLLFAPGTGWAYGVSIDVLGGVIAAVNGTTLGEVLARYVTGPLGMTDTGFTVSDRARLAVPYADGPPGLRRMRDPDTVRYPDGGSNTFSISRVFNPKVFQAGGSSGVGTPRDIAKLLETLRTGGAPILRPETVAMAMANQVGSLPRRPGDEGQRFGFFGAIIDDPVAANTPLARGSVRWGGVYGHNWSIDPVNGITLLSMSNTPWQGFSGPYGNEIRDAVYGLPAAV